MKNSFNFKSLKFVLGVLLLVNCSSVFADQKCVDFYRTKISLHTDVTKPRLFKAAYYRLMGLIGKSSDPIVSQFIIDLKQGWKGDQSEQRETLLPLFKKYEGKLTTEQYIEAITYASKKIVSHCDFCTLVGFKGLVSSSHFYELNAEQISKIRQALQNAIRKIRWNPFLNDKSNATFLANYSPIGKQQAEAEIKKPSDLIPHLRVESREALNQNLGHLLNGQYEGFALRRWGPKGLEYVETLASIQAKYSHLIEGDLRSLIVDSGIVTRMDSVLRFLNETLSVKLLKKNESKITPWELRKQFSDLLGKKTVYRALALSESEYAQIDRNGIESIFLRSGKSSKEDKLIGGSNPFLNPLQLQMEFRLSGPQLKIDPILSVSSDPQVAIAATIPYLERRSFRERNIKLYIFEIELPELDIYRRSEEFGAVLSFGDNTVSNIKLVLEDSRTKEKRSISRNDPGFEIFVDLKINRSEIVRASEVNLQSFPNIGYWSINGKKPRGQYGNVINLYELEPKP
ncbi:MAG: hypothetical protein L6Q37_03345 [Bdellovibrionaceae bacterium]|nr:hypothetical protein [Pseudobdellovibrionaceae bacterium]NUM57915.1 hypothetical protein [Pseudobdellovibrionaceae bacterium]